MTKYYLVVYNGNYADEFDVYFHTVLSKEELEKAKKLIAEANWTYQEFSFGTNEEIDTSTPELLECLDEARELTQEQYNVLKELGLTNIRFGDCLDWFKILRRAEKE